MPCQPARRHEQPPPWDIGRPNLPSALWLRTAAITDRVLDIGCGAASRAALPTLVITLART